MARDEHVWKCGECGARARYEPQYDGDLPRGWMRLEDEWCVYVVCSFKCLGALVKSIEERRTAPADERDRPTSTPTSRDNDKD